LDRYEAAEAGELWDAIVELPAQTAAISGAPFLGASAA